MDALEATAKRHLRAVSHGMAPLKDACRSGQDPEAESNQGSTHMKTITGISILLAALVLTTTVGCSSTRTQESTGEYLDDTAITSKVKAAIFNDASLKSAEINVETFKGRVQLSGFVSSPASASQAVTVARGVSGVTSVSNDMRIK